jgi:hypothetical protein
VHLLKSLVPGCGESCTSPPQRGRGGFAAISAAAHSPRPSRRHPACSRLYRGAALAGRWLAVSCSPSRPSGLGSASSHWSLGETTTTGQCACRRQGRATGPMACGGCPGWCVGRVVPSTSIWACAARSSNARAGGSSATSAVSCSGGRYRRASSVAAATSASAAQRSSCGVIQDDGGPYCARCLESVWYALTRWTVAWRSRASRTAQRTAASEAADPSTPTTIWLSAGECVIAHHPRDETVPIAISLAATSGPGRDVGPFCLRRRPGPFTESASTQATRGGLHPPRRSPFAHLEAAGHRRGPRRPAGQLSRDIASSRPRHRRRGPRPGARGTARHRPAYAHDRGPIAPPEEPGGPNASAPPRGLASLTQPWPGSAAPGPDRHADTHAAGLSEAALRAALAQLHSRQPGRLAGGGTTALLAGRSRQLLRPGGGSIGCGPGPVPGVILALAGHGVVVAGITGRAERWRQIRQCGRATVTRWGRVMTVRGLTSPCSRR